MTFKEALGFIQIEEPDLTIEVLNFQFKRLANRYHPDKPDGDAVAFKKLTECRDFLMQILDSGVEPDHYQFVSSVTEMIIGNWFASNGDIRSALHNVNQQLHHGMNQQLQQIHNANTRIAQLNGMLNAAKFPKSMVEHTNKAIASAEEYIRVMLRTIEDTKQMIQLLKSVKSIDDLKSITETLMISS
jgi:hypothetical protein